MSVITLLFFASVIYFAHGNPVETQSTSEADESQENNDPPQGITPPQDTDPPQNTASIPTTATQAIHFPSFKQQIEAFQADVSQSIQKNLVPILNQAVPDEVSIYATEVEDAILGGVNFMLYLAFEKTNPREFYEDDIILDLVSTDVNFDAFPIGAGAV